ncbi:MAG TPA: TfoX/Sxy family protein [Pseudolabrys sp.]|nr:TfoX/Sxy family protein [Pseudolabrys sp.]
MDADFIRELFARFGAVEIRRLFGGAGLYADGIMFGLLSSGEIYLKSDDMTAPRFAAEGCGPFEYATKTGRHAIASFRKMPDRLYDDADELAEWARDALGAARRNKSVKRKAPRKAALAKKSSTGKKR